MKDEYKRLKESTVSGRYVVNEQIIDFFDRKGTHFNFTTVGYSVQNRPIKSITLGEGTKKILMWSQMHGNESTTTKAVLDLVNFLDSNSQSANKLLHCFTIKILPILNPDGAHVYTRFNANQIDLNRDAQSRSQPESKVLRAEFDSFKPDFCFNLHDQRTIYNVNGSSKPATVSFLAPAHDPERTISTTRKVSMKIIAAMNETLQEIISGQVGRYDDAFNVNCIGDTFQMLNTPTILFEAGHFHEDYEREKTREFIFYSICKALEVIASDAIENYKHEAYFEIPENRKQFFDVLVKNMPTKKTSEKKDVGILYTEVLENNTISFIPKIEQTGNLEGFFGHQTYDCRNPSDTEYLKESNLKKILSF
jgi:hypothetical protein